MNSMARDYKWISKGQELGIDAAVGITGAVTMDSTVTASGAFTASSTSTLTGKVTMAAGMVSSGIGAIAANGTLGTNGVYVFNGADGAIHMPPVATNDGLHIIVVNQNGTGTATITDDATDSAPLIVDGATGASFLLTPLETVHLVGYKTGTCWFGIS